MASDIGFVEYVCSQISGAGDITYKKMFGEYGIYVNGKIAGLICNDQFFFKDYGGRTLKAP
ncbi:MAG: TfoX/Sxy family protein [Dehalococcoidales bacterium]|nr:TfoX/Sxy family protein [Dehalococcoidales bacterium]